MRCLPIPILLWLASGDRALSGKARTMIENAQILCVSPVTAWEIAVKASKRKIQLPLSPREWFDAVVKLYDIHVLKLTADDMLKSAELPWLHKDPADRFIIATAIKNDFIVVTADGNFSKYGVKTIC